MRRSRFLAVLGLAASTAIALGLAGIVGAVIAGALAAGTQPSPSLCTIILIVIIACLANGWSWIGRLVDIASWPKRMRYALKSRTCVSCDTVKVDADGGVAYEDLPYEVYKGLDLATELEDAGRISRIEHLTLTGGFIKSALFGPTGRYVPAWSIARPSERPVTASETE